MPHQDRPTLKRFWVRVLTLLAILPFYTGAVAQQSQTLGPPATSAAFPRELVHWAPRAGNPIFTAAAPDHWDAKIRERGWILRDGDQFHLWYTGYDGNRESVKQLGHATSPDGIHWTRSKNNPLSDGHWVEDVMVVKCGRMLYMFAESDQNDFSVMLTSCDGDKWDWQGRLDVRMADGKTPVPEAVGTPTIWIECGKWYLFYERLDKGVWLATTEDVDSRVWTNVQDEPVLVPGPDAYDEDMIALNQIIKHKGAYYAFYHGSGKSMPRTWNTDIARSTDLIHWQKYRDNPLIEDNKSSGIVLPVGRGYRLYTMHDQVDVFNASDER
jgi:beta-1,2-mannobiose phosphorylase / 1,2-beta-oligomannan phosphorylase